MAALEAGIITPDADDHRQRQVQARPADVPERQAARATARSTCRGALKVSSDVFFYTLGERANARGPIIQELGAQARPRPPHRDRHPGRVRRPGARPHVARRGLREVPEVPSSARTCRPRRRGAVRSAAASSGRGRRATTSTSRSARATCRRRRCSSPSAYSAIANGGTVVAAAPGDGDRGRPRARRRGVPHHRRAPRQVRQDRPGHDPRRACTRAAAEPGGTSADVFKGFAGGKLTVYGKTGTVERRAKPDQSWYACYVPHPSAPDRRRRDGREGRLRRRDGGARRAPDPLAMVRSRQGQVPRGQLGHAMSASPPSSPPPSRRPPLVPREWRLRLDPLLLLATLGLVACSLIAIKGATADDVTGQPYYYLERQAVYAGVGLVLMYGVSRLDYSRLRELRYPIYGLLIGSILLVFALATATRGAKRWIALPFFHLQPSELGKVLLVVASSGFLVDRMRADGPRHDGAGDAARAVADDARHGRARPRVGAGLRRRRARAAVRRGRAVAALRRAGGAGRGRRLARARRGARDRRRGAQALPGGAPDRVPAPLRRSGRRGLSAAAVADRHRIRREDGPWRDERHPDRR